MVESTINHASILADDLDESIEFYEEVLGMEEVPAPNFPGREVAWLECGDLTLHLFDRDIEPADYYHVGFHVDDFESVYESAKEYGLIGEIDAADAPQTIYELPDGSIQMYMRDVAGNLIEINYHDINDLPQYIQAEIVPRSDQVPQTGEAAQSRLYTDEFLGKLGLAQAQAD